MLNKRNKAIIKGTYHQRTQLKRSQMKAHPLERASRMLRSILELQVFKFLFSNNIGEQFIPPIVTSTPMYITRKRANRWTVLFLISWQNLSSWSTWLATLSETISPARRRHAILVHCQQHIFELQHPDGPKRRTILRLESKHSGKKDNVPNG